MEKILQEEIGSVKAEAENEQEIGLEDLKSVRDELLVENKYKVYFNEEIAKFANGLKKKYPNENLESYKAYNDFMGITIRINKGEDEKRPLGPIVDVDKEDFTDPEDSILEFAKKLKKESMELAHKKEGEPLAAKYNTEELLKHKEIRSNIRNIVNDPSLSDDSKLELQMFVNDYANELLNKYGEEAREYVLFHSLGVSTFNPEKKHKGLDYPKIKKDDNDYSVKNFVKRLEKKSKNLLRKQEIESKESK